MPSNQLPYAELTDADLFDLVKKDNLQAFETLFNRYWEPLLNKAYKPLQCRGKAEDIVQDIFISLYQRRKSINLEVSLSAYLFKALKFKVFNEYRSQVVREAYKSSVLHSEAAETNNALEFEAKELQFAIEKSVSQLPERCREAYLLSRQENLSYKSISEQLQISVSTVEKHIIKALKTIQMNLNI